MGKAPKFRDKDIPFAITTLFQALIVQLMEKKVLTVDEGEHVFDVAEKRASRAKDAGDAPRLIRHVHDTLQWDKFYQWSAQQRRDRKKRDEK